MTTWPNTVFYEAVTASIKLDPQSDSDESLFGESWVKMTGSCSKELRQNLSHTEALQLVADQVEVLPSDRYLFVMHLSVDKHLVRVGLYRSPNADILKWGDTCCPLWCLPPVDGPSRYQTLMGEDLF